MGKMFPFDDIMLATFFVTRALIDYKYVHWRLYASPSFIELIVGSLDEIVFVFCSVFYNLIIRIIILQFFNYDVGTAVGVLKTNMDK